jgi:uncharacterized protein YndB with AHSA1/START domain
VTLVAHVSLTVDASRATVWAALVSPDLIRRYLPATDVISEWREGSSIVWLMEWQGKPMEVRGTIRRFDTDRVLAYDHGLPISRASVRDHSRRADNRVTIELSDDGPHTRVSVTEENHLTSRELDHSTGGWRLALHGLKALVEGTRADQ